MEISWTQHSSPSIRKFVPISQWSSIAFILRNIAFFFVVASTLYGCASVPLVDPPSGEETSKISAGEKSVVLLRVTASVNDAPVQLYKTVGNPPTLSHKAIAFGGFGARALFEQSLGFGKKDTDMPRFLSIDTLRDGWMFFTVEPGIYEFWFMSTYGLTNLEGYFAAKHAPRFIVNVPEQAKVVYIGSLKIPAKHEGVGNYWGEISFNPYDATLVDETNLARNVADRHMPLLESIKTSLMTPKDEEPMIIRKPG